MMLRNRSGAAGIVPGVSFAALRWVVCLSWSIATTAGCAHVVLTDLDRRVVTADYAGAEKLLKARATDLASFSNYELMNLCFVYTRLKRYDKVFPCLDHLDRRMATDDPSTFSRGLAMKSIRDTSAVPATLRAETYLELGRYREAVEAATRAYRIMVERNLHAYHRVNVLGVLALAHVLAGNAPEARRYRAELANLTWNAGASLELRRSTALARVYSATGEYHLSLHVLRNIVDNGVVTDAVAGVLFFGPGPLNTRLWEELPRDVLLARSLLETGNTREAVRRYDRLLARSEIVNSGDLHWIALFDRGRLAERERIPERAIGFYTRAIETIEQQRSLINTEVNKIGFVGDKQAVYARLIAALVARGRDAEALEYAERAKSRALVDLLAGRIDDTVVQGHRPETVSVLAELAVAESEARVQDDGSAADFDARRRRTIAITERLRATAPEMASLVTVTSMSAAEIQAHLRDDETLLEFYYHDDEAYAFIVGRSRLQAVALRARGLAADVASFRRRLETSRSLDVLEHSRRLYDRLIAPLEAHARTPHLVVVPHGVLHYLPFAALHSGETYVLERASVRYLPSASVLKYLSRRPHPSPLRLFAFGNPDLGDPRLALRFAEREVVAVKQIVPDTQILVGKEATETAFRRFAGIATHLHFAGHAEFDSSAPLASGLRLAADAEADGMLSVAEIYGLRLQADLVTLSACETGLGKVQRGDDVVGLTRGFLYAGASSVVASLWKVDDESTASLMTEFYRALRSRNKRDALRAAQLATREQFPHPFHWAAFQLTGLAD